MWKSIVIDGVDPSAHPGAVHPLGAGVVTVATSPT
jgi:hypothetical protein